MRARNGAAVAALMVIGAFGASGAQSAVAQATPTVSVTPDVIHDGDEVHIEISGFPVGYTAAVICEAAAATGPSNPGQCGLLAALAVPGEAPPSTTVQVHSRFSAYDGSGERDCATIPDGCVVGVVTATDTTGTTLLAKALEPIDFHPRLEGAGRQNLTDGAVVHLTGRFLPPGDYAVAQCDRAYLDDPTPAQAEARCGPATPVNPGPGEIAVDVVVHDPLVPTAGGPVPCGLTGCVVVLAEAGTPVTVSLGLSFGPTQVMVEPDTDVLSGDEVEVSVVGAPFDELGRTWVLQCVLPVAPTQQESLCANSTLLQVDEDTGSGSGPMTLYSVVAFREEVMLDCRVASCGVAVVVPEGDLLVGHSGPVTFTRDRLTVEPTQGLVDGQAMTVRGNRLAPGDYILRRCGQGCAEIGTVTADASGQFVIEIPAAQRFTTDDGRLQYCRINDCGLGLWRGDEEMLAFAVYSMAPGELTVAPDVGLEDGQEVQVTGTALMSTYAGPALLGFPTGGWALTQCSADVLGDLTLMGVFTHCSVAPPTRPVDVPGSTLDTVFMVESTITRILGGTTDCTEGVGCVVGLVRFEQDAGLSAHLRYVGFG